MRTLAGALVITAVTLLTLHGCARLPKVSVPSLQMPNMSKVKVPEIGMLKRGEVFPITYPVTPVRPLYETYFGTEVADPYRWLEEDIRVQPKVRAWVDGQNELARTQLELLPNRAHFKKRLNALWQFARYSVPAVAAKRYVYEANPGLLDQAQLMVKDSLEATPRVLLDPNTWSADGTRALADYAVDPQGRYVAIMTAESGSDWKEAEVVDVRSGSSLPERLRWLKYTSLTWTKDGKGFFYGRSPAPEKGAAFQASAGQQAIYYHRVNTPQSADIRVFYNDEHPEYLYSADVSDDGEYLFITTSTGTDPRYEVTYFSLAEGISNSGINSKPVHLIQGFTSSYQFIAYRNNEFLFLTNDQAPLGRVIAFRKRDGRIREVVKEKRSTLNDAVAVGDRLVLSYLVDAKAQLQLATVGGEILQQIQLPGIGSVSRFEAEPDSDHVLFRFSSYTEPSKILRLNTQRGEHETLLAAEAVSTTGTIVARQRFVTSRDGTRVPMFVLHHEDVVLNGANPTILYGYGGFNISLTPRFSQAQQAWVEAGGVFAIANLRGGGEYGEKWHKSGTKLKKQNVFDDFIAAAQALINEGYASPDHLAVLGGSNGGLLVGAVLNQRPDLFAAAIPEVGVMDMLRFHRFTAGRFWVDEYGSVEDEAEFKALFAYSPYHNISAENEYPAVLVHTADTDDRVVPAHSFKYTARLQAAMNERAANKLTTWPVLLSVESKAGHGAGTPTSKRIDKLVDDWSFLWHFLGGIPLSPAPTPPAPSTDAMATGSQ